MLNLPEIIIIIVIVVIVFGMGKVGNVGAHLRRAKQGFREGLDGKESAKGSIEGGEDSVIDITPPEDEPDESYEPKPGTRRDPIEDAEVEAP